MTFVIDYDGTITSNIAFFQQLIFTAKRSGHSVIILSGCNPKRRLILERDIEKFNIDYDFLICRPEGIEKGPKSIGNWKKQVLSGLGKCIWWDDEIKNYIDAGVDFTNLPITMMRT